MVHVPEHLGTRFRPDRTGDVSPRTQFEQDLDHLSDSLRTLSETYGPEFDSEPPVRFLGEVSQTLVELVRAVDPNAPNTRMITFSYRFERFPHELGDQHRFALSWPVELPQDVAEIHLIPSPMLLQQRRGTFKGGMNGRRLIERTSLVDGRNRVVAPNFSSIDRFPNDVQRRAFEGLAMISHRSAEANLPMVRDIVGILSGGS